MKAKDFVHLSKETVSSFSDDKATRLGAALAYYSLFSIGPMLMIVIAVAGAVFGEAAVRGEVFGQLKDLIGQQGAATVQTLVLHARRPATSEIASIIGIFTLILGACGVVTALKDALNTIWQVQPKAGKGIIYFIKTYVISLAAIIGIGFILMVSLVLSAALAAAGTYFSRYLPLPESVLHLLTLVVNFLVLMAIFVFMYKWLPDVRVRWRDTLMGAAVTSLLFSVGKLAIGLYLGKASFGSMYGAAGSIVVLLVWVYYSAQIFLLGAEFTQVYTRWRGVHVPLTPDVEPLNAAALANEGITKRPPMPTTPPLAPQPAT